MSADKSCKWAIHFRGNWRCRSPKNNGQKDINGHTFNGIIRERCVEGKMSFGIGPTKCPHYSRAKA
jgi:hypothetical protein